MIKYLKYGGALLAIALFIYSLVFAFTFNDENDAVKKISLGDAIFLVQAPDVIKNTPNEIFYSSDIKKIKKIKHELKDFYENSFSKLTNVNAKESIYSVLEKDNRVSSLVVKRENKLNSKDKYRFYSIEFDFNLKHYQMTFVTVPADFFSFNEAHAIARMDKDILLKILAPIYKVDTKDIIKIERQAYSKYASRSL